VQIFLSFTLEDRVTANALAADLRQVDYEPFVDEELTGGQAWWEQVLTHVDQCDVFMPVISAHYLESTACALEAQYAHALGKAFVAIVIDNVNLTRLPSYVTDAQRIDYSSAERSSVIELIRACKSVPTAPPLPDPMPARPARPIASLSVCRRQIDSAEALTYAQQNTLLSDLHARLDGPDRPAVLALLNQFAKRRDVALSIAGELHDLLGEHGTTAEPIDVLDEDVRFTVYRPRVVAPNRWYTLAAFAHKTDAYDDPQRGRVDPVQEVQEIASRVLDGDADSYDHTGSDAGASLPRGSELRFVPTVEGIEFNPTNVAFAWLEPVHHENFRLRASAALAGTRARGTLSVFMGAVLVGSVPLTINVDASAAAEVDAKAANQAEHARPYRKIFASYSHQDLDIVKLIGTFITATGDQFVRDWAELRSGEVWDERIREMIRNADVFELFWSSNSMNSRFVRDEWEYALSLRREHFVRPVFWERPMPQRASDGLPPPDLACLHFQAIDFDFAPTSPAPSASPPPVPPPPPGSAAPPSPPSAPPAPSSPGKRRRRPAGLAAAATVAVGAVAVAALGIGAFASGRSSNREAVPTTQGPMPTTTDIASPSGVLPTSCANLGACPQGLETADLSASPDSGLFGGEVVQLEGTGFGRNITYEIQECVVTTYPNVVCDAARIAEVHSDASGRFFNAFEVTKQLSLNGNVYDCSDSETHCVITAGQPGDGTFAEYTAIAFD
jgi:hypothetical protein